MFIKTFIYHVILTVIFAIIYVGIFVGLLVLIGFTTGIILGPRGLGFLIAAIFLGHFTAKNILSDSWLSIREKRIEKNKNTEDKKYLKEKKEYQNNLDKLADKYLVTRKKTK